MLHGDSLDGHMCNEGYKPDAGCEALSREGNGFGKQRQIPKKRKKGGWGREWGSSDEHIGGRAIPHEIQEVQGDPVWMLVTACSTWKFRGLFCFYLNSII